MRIRLGDSDCALIIRADGSYDMYLPEFKPDEVVPPHAMLVSSVSCRLSQEGWIDEMIGWMAHEIEGSKGG